MASTPRAKRTPKAAPPVETPPTTGVLYVRNVPVPIIVLLDMWVAERREELAAVATDTASRRTAASFSRNDLLADIIDAAVRARGAGAST